MITLKHISIGDLPPNVLHHIILTVVQTDNLLRYVAACARVWSDRLFDCARAAVDQRKHHSSRQSRTGHD